MNELISLEAKRKQLSYEIRQQQRNEHRRLYNEHKAMFRLMDIAVVLIVIMNFGAVALTNLMAVRKTPAIVDNLTEANVVHAKVGNYEVHPEAKREVKIFVSQALIWALILFCYMYYRNRVWNEFQLGLIVFCVCFYFIVCGRDFFNNFGYFIGKVLFGV